METIYTVKTRYERPREFTDEYDAAEYATTLDTYIENTDVDADEYIDEAYGHIEICGTKFWASQILKSLDDYTYNELWEEERRNTAEGDKDWLAREIRQLEDGDEGCYNGVTISCRIEYDDEDLDEDCHNINEMCEVFDLAT